MWAERSSLRRFLVFYLASTFFLVGVGEYLYYIFSKSKLIEEEKYYIKSELRYYLNKNANLPDIVKLKKIQSKGIMHVKIAIYKNNRYIYGDLKPEKIYFNNEFWVDRDIVYFLLIIPKKWGKIYVLCSKPIDKESLFKLKKELLIFSVFAFFFISFSAYVLGKIFLRPMKMALKNLEDFIESVSHEINTPLSIILNNVEMLQLKAGGMDELLRIKSATIRLNKMFRDLVYVRFNQQLPKKIERINVKDLLEERLSFFKSMIESKKLKIDFDVNEFEINADKEDMIRLFDNLISNAIKYSPTTGNVSIFSKESGKDSFSLVFRNQGYINNIESVTEKYFRENRNEGGFGLGLFIVRKIVDYYKLGFEMNTKGNEVFINITFPCKL